MAFDPYRILGIAPGAKPKEIKEAFRRKVRHLHPDAGGEEKLFLELKRSYDFLLEKYSPLRLEIVKERPVKGNYVFSFLDVTAEELALGEKVTVAIPGPMIECKACQGTGKNLSGRKVKCTLCEGLGKIDLVKGISQVVCPECGGVGEKWLDLCPKCRGKGVVSKDIEITLKLPLGARPGDILFLSGEKLKAGVDLYFELIVHEKDGFYFEGNRLVIKVKVPFWEVALRGEISFRTLEGYEKLKIPEDLSREAYLVFPRRGAYLPDGSRDDLLVKLEVYFPTNLPDEVFKKLEEIKEIVKEDKNGSSNS
ncbi:hypothetical protein TH606_02340 [Thermodesulfatator autotrophicus]|uniref:Chaperone protein DnaJ n=2 Tax=Thermodesulfatator autotrophicus TaxID=1795632 RepID=A0A177EA68_9BACT|nr:hypothetical protein TH606_02340 [Thermodesulfatator autotrophicus]